MNKKFSTLMAGLMLASAFSVGAQTEVQKYESGKAYLLGDAEGYVLKASSDAQNYGELTVVEASKVANDLTTTKECLWIATVTQGSNGSAPKFVFINKATNLVLSVDPTKADKDSKIVPNQIAGSASEWLNSQITDAGKDKTLDKAPFYSYYDTNKVVYFTITNGVLEIKVGTPSEAVAANVIQPLKAGVIEGLSAYDLNTQLLTAKDQNGWFNLSFDKDVTSTGSNLFANTALQAEYDYTKVGDALTWTGYVRLKAKDKKVNDEQAYIVVDTAYHVGTESTGQLVKFTYANMDEISKGLAKNELTRLYDSYLYKFSYEPNEDRLIVEVKDFYIKGDPDADFDGSRWTTKRSADFEGKTDYYLRLATLTSVRELTVADAPVSTINKTDSWNDADFGMLTTVKIGTSATTWSPSTIASGLYTIKLHLNDRTVSYAKDGQYYIANLSGDFGYADQSKNQLFDHMPAAQWYVQQQGNTATAPVTITNREFNDLKFNQGNMAQAFKTADGHYFFGAGPFGMDTLEFIPVTNVKDSKLGYKYVTPEQASIESYVFDYLHGLSLEYGLNTPADQDSLVRVDETGEKISFRLVPVVTDDSYGYQFDEKKTGIANLVRNAYYIKAYDNLKFAKDDQDRYLTYNAAANKYIMSTIPTAFFLKENNDVDGTHYYALVEANFLSAKATGKGDDANDVSKLLSSNTKIYYKEYAGMSTGEGDEYATYNDLFTKYVVNSEDYNKYGYSIPVYDVNGQRIILDNSNVVLYAYQDVDGVVALKKISSDGKDSYLNPVDKDKSYLYYTYNSDNYASARVSVDDNTLDLTQAVLGDKWNNEIRVSAFAVVKDNKPLYRRFNAVAPEEYGDAANSPLNLKFYRYNNPAEFLFENLADDNKYRDGINDKSISFLGVNNAYQFEETADRSYTMFVDTAYVRGETRMPQYLIGVRPEFIEGDTIWCNATSAHHHDTLADSLACDHTVILKGFTRAMYLFNAQDSIDAKNYDYQGKAAYGAQGYTRLAFKDAVHAQDTLYILKDSNIKSEDIVLDNGDLFSEKIALDNNKHKNVVFQFRLVAGDDNRFMIESEAEQDGWAVLNSELKNVCIAPDYGGWVKIQNGVPVIARISYNDALTQAEIFDVNDEIKYDATANDEVAVEGVTVVAGNGQVTIMGAAGKNVTITNILGKVIASQVIASDNATIAVPAGIVAVAVEGEAAVKAIVK